MRNFLLTATCSLFLLLGGPADAAEWVYRLGVLSVLDSSTFEAIDSIAVGRVDAMSSDGRGGLWYSTPGALLRRDSSGALQLKVDLERLGISRGVDWIAADPHAAQAWVTDGSSLLAIGREGAVRIRRVLSARPIALAVAQDQHLWILEKGRVLRLRRDGSLASAHDLRAALQSDARQLVLDDLGDRVWILGMRRGVALDFTGKLHGRFSLAEPSLASCVMPGRESLWTSSASALERRGLDGTVHDRIAWSTLALTRPIGLVCHWLRQEVWLLHEAGIARLDPAGALVGGIGLHAPARVEPVAFHVRPAVRLVQPPRDALTGDSRPAFELALSPACPDTPCPPLGGYLDRLRLDARLDAREVGSRFTVDTMEGSAVYRPDTALADGAHRLIARMLDRFGHASPPLETVVTVDTVAPIFLAVTPADGTIVDSARATITGTVDDRQASVVLENLVAIGGTVLPAEAGQFAFSVPLRPGSNQFVLSAIDRAGNVTRRALRIDRIGAAIGVVVASPSDGTTVQADSVIVQGTLDAGGQRAGVSINGEPATLIGNGFYAQVALHPGSNLLEIRVTSADGVLLTRTVTVTRQGERSFQARAWPAVGIAPHDVSFDVDELGVRAAATIRIDYQGDGTVDFSTTDPSAQPRFTYQVPGVYTARVTVTDAAGEQESHDVQVVVQDLATLDQDLRALVGTMLSDLRAGDLEAALHAFSPGVRSRYRALFELARTNLAGAVDGLGIVKDGSIAGPLAEYVMVQDRPTGPKAYFVYLIRARDGLWRIQQM